MNTAQAFDPYNNICSFGGINKYTTPSQICSANQYVAHYPMFLSGVLGMRLEWIELMLSVIVERSYV